MKRAVLASLLLCTPSLSSCAKGSGGTAGAQAEADEVDLLAAPIPADARAVIVMRSSADALSIMEGLAVAAPLNEQEMAAMRLELDTLLEQRLGIQATAASGLTLYGLDQKRWVLLVHGLKASAPQGSEAYTHEGQKVLEVEGQRGLFMVPFADGVAFSFDSAEPLKTMIDVEHKGAPSFADSDTPLRTALKGFEKGYLLAALDQSMFDGRELDALKERGIEQMVATFSDGNLVMRTAGDTTKLEAFKTEIEGYIAMGVMAAKAQARDLDEKPLEEALPLVYTKHHLDAVQRAFKPQVVDGGLELRVATGTHNGAMVVAMGGVLAAIAIPAFTKYTRRAKTSEARAQLAKMFDGISSAASQHPNFQCPTDGRPEGSVGPTPPLFTNCNEGPGGRCVPAVNPGGPGYYELSQWSANQAWSQLNFMQEQAHYFHYQYNWKNTEQGCQFTAAAYADLDDDGIYSTYERAGSSDRMGVNAAAGLYIEGEVE